MKKKKVLLLICAATILMTGCAGVTKPVEKANVAQKSENAQVTEKNEQAEGTSKLENTELAKSQEQGEKSGKEENTEATDKTNAPEKKTRLHIEGFSNDNIPRLDGSLANEPLLIRIMSELTGVDADTAETYMAESFVNGGTSTSWGKLIYDELDLIISYEPPQEVKADYNEYFDQLEINALGRDGLVFIVNVNNPIESLTIDQIRDIYTGKIKDWSEVGGEPGEIKAFQRNSTSGSQTLLKKLVMNGKEPMEPEKDLLVGSMGGLIESVKSFDGGGSAIGFSVYYYADKMKADPDLKMIKVEGVEPSNQSIGDGSYPLINDFYMAIQANEPQDSPARALRDWLMTEDGKALLEEEGYVWTQGGMW